MLPLCVLCRREDMIISYITHGHAGKGYGQESNWFLWVWVTQPKGLFIPYSGLRGKTTDTHFYTITHSHARMHNHTQPPIPYLYYNIVFIITWRERITRLHLAMEMRDSRRWWGYQALLFFPGVRWEVRPTDRVWRQTMRQTGRLWACLLIKRNVIIFFIPFQVIWQRSWDLNTFFSSSRKFFYCFSVVILGARLGILMNWWIYEWNYSIQFVFN